MKINDINIIRILALLVIACLLIYTVVICIKHLKKQGAQKDGKFALKIALALIMTAVIFLAVFFPFGQFASFKISNELKSTISNVSYDKIDFNKFEDSTDEENDVSDRKVYLKEKEHILVFCFILPKGTYTERFELPSGKINNLVENLYSKKCESLLGNAQISPVYTDRIYGIFASSFYGNIVIPLNDEYDLVVDYECSDNMNECYSVINDALLLVCTNEQTEK